MPTLLLTALFVLVAPLARADTSSSHDVKNVKKYGNCMTETYVDLFTDREDHIVVCSESTLTDMTAIGVYQTEKGSLRLILSKGVQFRSSFLAPEIPVVIRIDKGKVIRRSALEHNRRYVYVSDDALVHQMLHDLARGQRAIIRVDDESGNVKLDGAAKAIRDFRQRAGLQPQQTLDIPAR